MINMLKRLPDAFLKDSSGNIGKLYQIFDEEMQLIYSTYDKIKLSRDIDKATGYTLDKAGKNVNQSRGSTPDKVYRVLIKAKAKRNLSDGSINTIIEILSFLLNTDASEINVIELWPEGQNAAIQVDIPAGAVNATGLTLTQFVNVVDLITAGGIRVLSLFEGTFSFSSIVDQSEIDNDAGFADINQTSGGTLGAYYDPTSSNPLPL